MQRAAAAVAAAAADSEGSGGGPEASQLPRHRPTPTDRVFENDRDNPGGQASHDYQELHRWSVTHPEAFWSLWLEQSGIRHTGDARPVHDDGPFHRRTWFPQVSLSFAANLLRWALAEDADTREALVAYRETPSPQTAERSAQSGPGTRTAATTRGQAGGHSPQSAPATTPPPAELAPHSAPLPHAQAARRAQAAERQQTVEPIPPQRLTYGELIDAVLALRERIAPLLAPGDAVAAVVPNGIEAVVAMLATVSLGAVWSSASPDFGTEAVVDRFFQVEPKVLLGCSRYSYGGTPFEVGPRMESVRSRLPSVELALAITDDESAPPAGFERFSVRYVPDPGATSAASWSPEGRRSPKGRRSPEERRAALEQFEQFPFDHPVYTMFSSGTTGAPKGIIHGAGGTLLQHTKEHILHSDLHEGDRILYFTTCGWMMWNWLVSALFTGATVVLFDGSPVWPAVVRLWDVVQEEGLTHLGVSPRYLSACRARRIDARHRARSLRVLFSTGAPLLPEDFDYVYERLAPQAQLASISGGTDIISCFMLGVPTLPVRRGEIQAAGLGMDVIAADGEGAALIGQRGELVCRTPFPSRPVGFLGDDAAGSRYHRAYFERFPGWWTHGDYIEITGSVGQVGGIIVYGRSDATLNPGGVRIGTAEIYRHVEALEEVADSLVVGRPIAGDVEVVLFVVPTAGVTVDDALQRRIRTVLREQASPRHVPKRIFAVTGIPYTRSGKKVELAIRDILQGAAPT
ncbi:MAG: acetoacetate--CoA ligase, partial [Alkalispirochaeta sp.]